MIRFDMIVWSQICLDLFLTIRFRNALRFEQTVQRKFDDDEVIPWIAASKSSNQKSSSTDWIFSLFRTGFLQVILFEIDCANFYTNLLA